MLEQEKKKEKRKSIKNARHLSATREITFAWLCLRERKRKRNQISIICSWSILFNKTFCWHVHATANARRRVHWFRSLRECVCVCVWSSNELLRCMYKFRELCNFSWNIFSSKHRTTDKSETKRVSNYSTSRRKRRKKSADRRFILGACSSLQCTLILACHLCDASALVCVRACATVSCVSVCG